MKLIFIRHGEPNYEKDCLTDKGRLEAEALAKRVAGWDVTAVYCSPLGRARETASYSLKALNAKAVTFEWLKEFCVPVTDPDFGEKCVPWDFLPSFWTSEPKFYDKEHWFEAPVLQDIKSGIRTYYEEVCHNLDKLLNEYGYVRTNGYYRVDRHPKKEEVLVFFCHLGVSYVCLSHLLGISPSVLWQGFFSAPTSVTILGSEERTKGEAGFRCQVLGDTRHLADAGIEISTAGYFADVFQG